MKLSYSIRRKSSWH